MVCNDIMWIIGQYVETYRNNKKIETLFNIVPTETEIQNITDSYNDMKYKDILYYHKNVKCFKQAHNKVSYNSGKNGTKTKADKLKEIVICILRKIINEKFRNLTKQFKYNNPDYPNMVNDMTNEKLFVKYRGSMLFQNVKYIEYKNTYLKSIIDTKDKNTLEMYEKISEDYVGEDYGLDRTTREFAKKFLDDLGDHKYKDLFRNWNGAWRAMTNPKPLTISNLYDTIVPKEFLDNSSQKYMLWKRNHSH